MKLNKTLTEMKKANDEGYSMTMYGEKAYDRILGFRDVVSCEISSMLVEFKLTDGSTITAFYNHCAE